MSLISAYVSKEDLGSGRFRNEIAMRPRAVLRNGVWRTMTTDLADDGDAARPHAAMDAPLRTRIANDGMRRFYLVPGDDAAYFEMGQPFVQVGGTWTQVSLGTPSRTGHTLTWTRPQTVTTVKHGGHYLDLRIELLGGYVPENSRIAFPVGLVGLTRQVSGSGLNIQHNGVTVARLRPFQMIDAADPMAAPRPISHNFTARNGQPFLVLTLPSLAGMVRPVIDPTVEIQPDGTAGLDTQIVSFQPTSNFATGDFGFGVSGGSPRRTLIKFDLSTLPDAAVISSTALAITNYGGGGSGTHSVSVYRTKRDWVEAQATWNIWKTSNNWSTAGGFHADDCEQTAIGTQTMDRASTGVYTWALTPVSKSALDLGNGWLMKMVTETGAEFYCRPSEYATAGDRPKLTVEYTEAATSRAKFFMHYARLRQ